MFSWFEAAPGRLYVVATLLPLAAFVVLLVAGGVRSLCRPFRRSGGFAESVYWVCGGDRPLKTGAYFATAFMAVAAVLGIVGLVKVLTDPSEGSIRASRWAERIDWVHIGAPPPSPAEWKRIQAADHDRPPPGLALALEVGYKIDTLTAVVFAMVTFIGTFIFIFSLGYMRDETRRWWRITRSICSGRTRPRHGSAATRMARPKTRPCPLTTAYPTDFTPGPVRPVLSVSCRSSASRC